MQRPTSRSRKASTASRPEASSVDAPTAIAVPSRSRKARVVAYRRQVDTAIRELAALETTAVPAYHRALDRTDLEPVAHRLEIRRAGQRVDHLLGVVDDTLRGMWETQWFGDRVVAMLLGQLATIKARVERADERSVPVIACGTPARGVRPRGPQRP